VWTDSHCHLDVDDTVVVDEARAAGVTRMVTIGTDYDTSRNAIATARAHDDVYATVGLHPHDAKNGLEGFDALVDDGTDVVVGIGECGLDYHYDHSPRDTQRDVFAAQIEIANARRLPLIIHTREAWDDTFAILDEVGIPERAIFHCFTGGPDEARRCLERNTALSFSGIVTFKNADDVRAAAALCPPDRMLVETDSPFLTPVPHRGQKNSPAYVPLVGAAIAQVRGVSTGTVEALTWENATAWLQLRPTTGPT
jgi:TatD DNase family protein